MGIGPQCRWGQGETPPGSPDQEAGGVTDAVSWEDVPARGRCWLSVQGKVGLGAVWLECGVWGEVTQGGRPGPHHARLGESSGFQVQLTFAGVLVSRLPQQNTTD